MVRSRDEADRPGPLDRIAASANAQLPVDRERVRLDRVARHVEPVGDGRQRQMRLELLQDTLLRRGQFERSWAGRCGGEPPTHGVDPIGQHHCIGLLWEELLGFVHEVLRRRWVGPESRGLGEYECLVDVGARTHAAHLSEQ